MQAASFRLQAASLCLHLDFLAHSRSFTMFPKAGAGIALFNAGNLMIALATTVLIAIGIYSLLLFLLLKLEYLERELIYQ
jgi:hypothetical protein